MDHVVLKKEGTYAEILNDIDYSTFKYDYEKIMNVPSPSLFIKLI